MERIAINIVDRAYHSKRLGSHITVQKRGRVIFRSVPIEQLGVEEGAFILLGNVGESWFVCKKPKGYFGYKLRKEGKSKYLIIGSKALEGVPEGEYRLGDISMDANDIPWFPLIKDGE